MAFVTAFGALGWGRRHAPQLRVLGQTNRATIQVCPHWNSGESAPGVVP
jgi:hypothetical protein